MTELTPNLFGKIIIVGISIYALVYLWGGLSAREKYYDIGKG